MSDFSSMSRESKKDKLRRQIVSPQQPAWNAEPEEDSEAVVRRAHNRVLRHRWILVLLVLLLIAAGAAAWFFYQRNYRYSGYETAWQVDLNEGSLVGYESFGTNVLKYTKDGASYLDNRGRTVWTESYEMKSPIISVKGDYAAIADMQGNSIYICNTDGTLGQATTVLPISKVAVSGTGVTAAVLEDSASSYITFFQKDGTSLDITVKTNMSGDGYPLDIALSDDGTQLMSSFVYLQGSELKNRVVFYDFSEIGKNVPNRLVGGFDDEFQGDMVPRVTYMGNPYSCAFSGKALTFFSSRNLASPELVEQRNIEERIDSVFYSDEYAAAIVRMSEDALKVGKQDTSAITGSLRLGISGQLSCERLSSRIAHYLQDYPQVDVNVQVIAEPEELLFRLRHNDIDLALTLDLLRTDTDLIHAAKDLPAPLHAFAAKGHPLAGQTGLSGEELSHYPLICTGHFEAGLDHKLHAPGSGQIRISDTALALSIAADSSRAAGSAPVILVPDLIVRIHPAAQKLVRLDYEPSASPFWLQVLCHRNKWLTGAMKAWLADSEESVFSL